jgi:hypothetical protein
LSTVLPVGLTRSEIVFRRPPAATLRDPKTVFRCKVTGGQLTTNDEITAFRWADEDTIRQLTSEAYAVRLLDGLRNDTSPAIRGHDGTHLL